MGILSGNFRESQLAKFYASLPVQFPVCGYMVSIERCEHLIINVSQQRDGENVPDILWRTIEATRDEVRNFLNFYIRTPVGPAVFTFRKDGYNHESRIRAINYALNEWRKINGPRDAKGRLKKSLDCIAYINNPRYGERCAKRTLDPKGLCNLHISADTPTLWNYEEFTEQDEAHAMVGHLTKSLFKVEVTSSAVNRQGTGNHG
jgi:hypothetical protein